MAYPRKKVVKKTASPRKRKAPAKKMSLEERIEERMADFLWTLCGLGGSPKVFEEYEAIRDAYQALKPAARKELRTIAAQVVSAMRSVNGLVLRERPESGTSKR